MNMESERLILEEFTRGDFKKAESMPVNEAMLYFGVNTAEEVAMTIKKMHYRFVECSDGFISWRIIEKKSNLTIGYAGFHAWVKLHDRAELGYALNSAAHGKGYATEASVLVVEYGFDQLNLHRIEAYVGTANLASQRILKKLGFSHEGMKKQHYKIGVEYSDSEVYGLVRPDYLKHKA